MTKPGKDMRLDQQLVLPLEGESSDRRSFLRLMGFGVAAGALASCSRAPTSNAVPWLTAPEDITAGRAYRMATTCAACPTGCGALVTCKDGRPLKMEGLVGHAVSAGALCAIGQASILELYDSQRIDGPQHGGKEASWADADAAVIATLETLRAKGRVRLLTDTRTGPATLGAIRNFLDRCQDGRHVMYDPLSCSAMAAAHLATHGVRAVPRADLAKVRVLASFDADFLGTWYSPVEHARGWAAARREKKPGVHSRHWHFESAMTVTGGVADIRRRLAPHEIPTAITILAELVEGRGRQGGGLACAEDLALLAAELRAAKGSALVLCGVNDSAVQTQVNRINAALGAYGTTLSMESASRQRLGDDAALATLFGELDSGSVDLLIVAGVNPAFDHPDKAAALAKARMLVSLATNPDETSALAQWICPESHFLERWDDHEAVDGLVSVGQPLIRPLMNGRTLRMTLTRWSGEQGDELALLKQAFESGVFPRQKEIASFPRWWRDLVHSGSARVASRNKATAFNAAGVQKATHNAAPAPGAFALVIAPKLGILDGRHAHNPWLQELSDPISRLAWECEACLSPAAAARLGVSEGDVVRLSAAGHESLKAPVHIVPGQHDEVITFPPGYGRKATERFAGIGPEWWEGKRTLATGERLGSNAAAWRGVASVTVERTGEHVDLATVQDYRSLEVPAHLAPPHGAVRDHVRHASVAALALDAHAAHAGLHHPAPLELWSPDHANAGPRWGLSIDLSACNGCSACVIACQAENNVPVVGRDEVQRHREMAWIRIDRYESGTGDDVVVHQQPMMCQHCGHAPCESVCPVLATVHSADGLNQQVYTRCVGTRYCANTCPYKVRRFNWFDYPHEDALENHALNPDVTVRTRGVMEKCSLCVQRIQEARLEARRLGMPVADGDIQTACQQTCPTDAIVFGNLADPKSAVALLAAGGRSYRVLEELNVAPSVHYLADVRNPRA